MRVLLVQTPQVFRDVISLQGIDPPLNLAYIASALELPERLMMAYGHPVPKEIENFVKDEKISTRILDLQFYREPLAMLKKMVRQFKPDVVGFTAFTIQADWVGRLANACKEIEPGIFTVFGGAHASALPVRSLEEMPAVDAVVIGEGEMTLLELCSRVNGSKKEDGKEEENNLAADLDSVPGIAYRGASGPVMTGPRPLIRDLDALPYPAREKLELDRYRPFFINYWRLPSTGIMSSRGCPFGCAYCSKAVFKRHFRQRSPENVLAEMKYCEDRFGIKDFRFFDDAVTINRKWITKFCKLLIKENRRYTWNAFSRVAEVDEEILALMKRAGCYHVKFGVETGSERILKQIHKTTTLEQARRAIKATDAVGMESLAYYIINFPGESVASMQNTIRFAKELNATYSMFFHCKPLPGSELYKNAVEKGTLLHENWRFYGEEDPPLLADQVRDQEVINMLRKAYNSYYLRPRYMLKWIRFLLKGQTLAKVKRLVGGIRTFMPARRDRAGKGSKTGGIPR